MGIHVLIPSAGASEFFRDSYYPKTLVEVAGRPMLQRVIDEYRCLPDVRYVFVFQEEECRRFHTDNIARLLTEGNCDVIMIRERTMGALCTCLLAADYINNDERLIIANNDEVRDVDYVRVLSWFDRDGDAGVISFENYHPRWTYIRTEGDYVIEVAEKRPISKLAVTGFYYFRHGSDFVEAAKQNIRKGNTNNGIYYVSGALNELILKNKRIRHFPIEAENYHSLYSMERVKQYERWVDGK